MLEDTLAAVENFAWLGDHGRGYALRVREWASEYDPDKLSFFAPDFALESSRPWLVGEEIPWPSLALLSSRPLPPIRRRSEPSAADFSRLHEEILARIARGEFAKVVPIVCEEIEFEKPLAATMFPRVLSDHPGQFSYGFEFQGEGLCGVTPELLFDVQGDRLQTMALAGTARADGPSLLQDAKECREHDLVIQHIAGELKAFGETQIGATVERTYGELKHLYTPISAKLSRPTRFMELLVRLHPTAALGGWPRKPAIEWLQRQSFHFTRRRFGAPFGYQHRDRMMCVVAIRGWQWQGACATVASGCGVVEGSEALREWKELALKREVIYRHMGLSASAAEPEIGL
jgi:menaquinone-specific isochorismate synthase